MAGTLGLAPKVWPSLISASPPLCSLMQAEAQCEVEAQASVDGTGPYFPNEQILNSTPYGQWPGYAARTVEDCGDGCCPITNGL